jgi:lysylphosphatidylglycerol synthetase-like protein (DUF2156 family)
MSLLTLFLSSLPIRAWIVLGTLLFAAVILLIFRHSKTVKIIFVLLLVCALIIWLVQQTYGDTQFVATNEELTKYMVFGFIPGILLGYLFAYILYAPRMKRAKAELEELKRIQTINTSAKQEGPSVAPGEPASPEASTPSM